MRFYNLVTLISIREKVILSWYFQPFLSTFCVKPNTLKLPHFWPPPYHTSTITLKYISPRISLVASTMEWHTKATRFAPWLRCWILVELFGIHPALTLGSLKQYILSSWGQTSSILCFYTHHALSLISPALPKLSMARSPKEQNWPCSLGGRDCIFSLL